jgi:5-methylcytosine-specific restriction enzyme A
VTGFPNRVRDIITRRSDGACERCGLAAPAYQLHHRRCRGMGGSSRDDTNQPANGFTVCISCHNHIESNREEALFAGWLVRQGHDPATVPVMRRGEWVLLDNDGYYTPAEGAA